MSSNGHLIVYSGATLIKTTVINAVGLTIRPDLRHAKDCAKPNARDLSGHCTIGDIALELEEDLRRESLLLLCSIGSPGSSKSNNGSRKLAIPFYHSHTKAGVALTDAQAEERLHHGTTTSAAYNLTRYENHRQPLSDGMACTSNVQSFPDRHY
ncbi:hypothetical protein SADUNF_Sadunf16G0254500 [Salix dunnii]|uniref:Uncharacterized protein n=1 Tax=Salix dunnii TaxID=1413687 RepID=A0A835JGB7_9ROSI|nr:hypothetical protein SADUNF_Sadunf16G0254500 [Salix dunnii]